MLSSPLRGSDGVALGLLRHAGSLVAEEWADRPERQLPGQRVAVDIVDELVGAVEACFRDEETELFVGDVPDRYAYHRLLQEIRVRLLECWWEARMSLAASDASGVLTIVFYLEKVRRELWPDNDEDLAARLAAPDSFELLVEVAHDMRSPLSSILFLSETLRASRSGDVNELQRRQLGLIYGAALGLLSITNDVVDAARRGGSVLDEEASPFSLSDVFDSIEELVRPVAEEKGLSLEFRGPDRNFYRGHQMALTRVLLNLVTNALKYTEEGQVSVAAERVDRTSVEFFVTDTGRGMDADEIENLFHSFRKSEYRQGHFFSGSGLGLSIARQLLTAMGTDLEVESSVGDGTRFSFRLELPNVSSH